MAGRYAAIIAAVLGAFVLGYQVQPQPIEPPAAPVVALRDPPCVAWEAASAHWRRVTAGDLYWQATGGRRPGLDELDQTVRLVGLMCQDESAGPDR